ncbi:hypothetical protein SAMN05660653_01131 [Desulfonatronum thiosulfatophilum]|uniref:Uncharacterized protein n=1 Tax=Desulfonatronum thiosulfatophilum TaxID=617002 RepID=A0A1G6BR61_9BACT|nr:hypothetical protein [Desulfonatronum thiosulfatophilum]SDB23096.1 hypothetical protein SAMN05660653_01131 [Desulfonatronum thiosulfatophilum]
MEMPAVTSVVMETQKIQQAEPNQREGNSQADAMKNIRKARLQRQVLQDPAILSKLVAMETTPVYNAKGDVVQAVSGASLES